MARNMFGDIVDPSVKVGTKQWYTVPLSILVHSVAVSALIVVPLLASNMLPTPQSVLAFAAVSPPPPPPPPPPPLPAPPTATATVPNLNPDAAPLEAPTVIAPEPPAAPRISTVKPEIGGIAEAPGVELAPPTPLPAPAPVRVGGDVKYPTIQKQSQPEYPPVARAAKISGNVYIDAIIGVDGRVRDARVTGGHPLLAEAALAAVRQWVYSPTLLNKQPVEVQLSVAVTFKLN